MSASQRGLEVWASVVFPSLLPFFIVAELLIAFGGVVHFIGVLCEPIMRPLFNVPGVGGDLSGQWEWLVDIHPVPNLQRD
ncbi:membrane protein [Gracilibacillus boraciitolerans JCM 21714]|uniref:Membrane protein n=1 Tax=Gracilibacillus boraciitolerans JCM 21714 TaxID=1298598 RepID=W4VF03_9BACI|nr:membrane protein [Gracilibacillus boraciitolerans JCM 21714]